MLAFDRKFERLRLLIGALLVIAGMVVVTVIGAFYGYSNTAVWLIGVGLIVLGLLTANSAKLIIFLADILRF